MGSQAIDPANLAGARLAILSAHLAGAAEGNHPLVAPSPVLAGAPPGDLRGSLAVVDRRTGKSYDIPVSSEGTVRATDIKKIAAAKEDKGLKLYDPGYLNTAPVRSTICYIDGDEGILRYRGYPVEELAEHSSYLEVAYLLLYGNLPSQSQLADWEFSVSQHSAVPQGVLDIIQGMPHDAHPMGVLVSAISALSVFHPDANPALRGQDLYGSKQVRVKQIARILGKAVLKMLGEIGTIENIPDFIEGVKNRKRKLSGFGHRVYKNYDPRAKVIRKLADEVFSIVGHDPLIEVAVALEKAALSDEFFIKRKLYPNVDFYSGLIYRAMGFPPEYFTILFAIPRMAGYLAHWKESLDDPDKKIMRPQQVYKGVWLRHYLPLGKRQEGDAKVEVAVSNATRRRLAGSAL